MNANAIVRSKRRVLALLSMLVFFFSLVARVQAANAAPFIALQLPWPAGTAHNINTGNTYSPCGDHNGLDAYAIDFALNYQPVAAAAAGTVHEVSGTTGYGNYMWIAHPNGFVSLYGHLFAFSVANNSWVNQGQTIATSGNSGNSTGAHLHFSVRSGATSASNGSAYKPEPMSGYTGFGNYCHGTSPNYTSRAPTLTWVLRSSNNPAGATTTSFTTSIAGIPVSGNWSGTGRDMPGVVTTTSDGALQWNLWTTSTSGSPNLVFKFGHAGDTPVVGDWDANGSDTPAVTSKSSDGVHLTWSERSSNNASGATAVAFDFGSYGDTPVAGDWNADGSDTPATVSKSSDGTHLHWWERSSNNPAGATAVGFDFGSWGDTPVAGDWNGDVSDTPATVSTATDGTHLHWWERSSNNPAGATAVGFDYGSVGQYPVTGTWVGQASTADTPGVVQSS